MLLTLLLFMHSPAWASQRCEQAIRDFDLAVAAKKAEFAKRSPDPREGAWVKAKLKNMVDVDQFMRKSSDLATRERWDAEEKTKWDEAFGVRYRQIDGENTDELEKLLHLYPWFKISQFGAEADSDAWLLVQHADEAPEFQRRVLRILATLYRVGETNPRNYAYLFDRVAASFKDPSQRKAQRYGTQGHCVGPGKWEPLPIEDPARVDERRREVGLGTMDEYIAVFKEICL